MPPTVARYPVLRAAARGAGVPDTVYYVCNDQSLWSLTIGTPSQLTAQSYQQLASIPEPATGTRNIMGLAVARLAGHRFRGWGV